MGHDAGIITPQFNFCCPECGIYIFAGLERFAQLVNYSFPQTIMCEEISGCCINKFISIESELYYQEGIIIECLNEDVPVDLRKNSCCDTHIRECVDNLLCLHSQDHLSGAGNFNNTSVAEFIDYLTNTGIIEVGKFVNNCTNQTYPSGVCIIVDFLKKYSSVLNNTVPEIIDFILGRGLVIKCEDNGDIAIMDVETYIQYIENKEKSA
jgi:hypothetical protein